MGDAIAIIINNRWVSKAFREILVPAKRIQREVFEEKSIIQFVHIHKPSANSKWDHFIYNKPQTNPFIYIEQTPN